MSQTTAFSTTKLHVSGWIGVGAIALGYAALYAVNYWLPLQVSNYTTRIWNWSLIALTLSALVVVVLERRHLANGDILLGLALAVLSALSYSLRDPDLGGSVREGLGVWISFMGATVLFKDSARLAVPAFRPPLAAIGKSLFLGLAIAIPFAIFNNLFFYLNGGAIRMQNALVSGFEALSPGIHEEIIFRYFVLALSLSLLKTSAYPRLAMSAALLLAVVPHSLNHLPDLFLQNPVMGLVMLIGTSLLFGLPMALLQVKRNLETAIAFHWFIDWTRFLLGF